MLKQNKCVKNKFRYLFFYLKIFALLLPDLRFDHHFLDMALRSVGRDLLLANLSGSGFLVNLVKYIQVSPDGNRIYHVNPFQTGRELLRSPKKNKCFKEQISLPVLSLENLCSSAAWFKVWSSFSWHGAKVSWPGSPSCKFVRLWLFDEPGEIQVHPDGNRIYHVNPFQTGRGPFGVSQNLNFKSVRAMIAKLSEFS